VWFARKLPMGVRYGIVKVVRNARGALGLRRIPRKVEKL
jgi:hypothetical protein